MDPLLLILRLVHVALGVFWAGTLIFTAVFLTPSVRDAGPDGARVIGAMLRRRFFDVMPAAAFLTILSGLWLYWRVSGGLNPTYVWSRTGVAFGLGGLAAIVAFVIGVAVMRPATLRAAALLQSAEREAQQATIQALRQRAAAAGRVVATLLTLAVVAMALGRYL
ncbi:MAG TPA: hypothetical protein VNI61_11270 [Gemmatimonadales bacterium]|nr:hypothetical protein [Gemmatimonadales bacterium]